MAGRIGEGSELLPAAAEPALRPTPDSCLDGVEIVDDDVQVGLLRVRRVRPVERVVAADLLEHQILAVAGQQRPLDPRT